MGLFEFARKIITYKYEDMDKPTHIDWGDPIDHLLRFSEKNFGVNPSIIINAYGDITILHIYLFHLKYIKVSYI